MRIERIELFHVAMPLIEPWRTAYGEDEAIHSLLCRIDSGSLSGWGESAPLAAPCYSPECAGGAFLVARDWLSPSLLGRTVQTGDELQAALAVYKGNPFAKAALDTAWWVLKSRRDGVPLHQILGGRRSTIAVGADFGVKDSIDELLEAIDGAVQLGFPRIKLKFRPGWDIPMLEAVRERFPQPVIHVDCNAGYTLQDIDLLRQLDKFNLAMIEQPLQHDDLVDHAELQQRLGTPVCLDESITSVRRTEQAIALGSCGVVNVKPGRVGGLTPAIRIHDLCQSAGVPCWVGGMLESATGSAICSALASLDNFSYPADIFPTERFYREDLAERPLELRRDGGGTPCVELADSVPDPDANRLQSLTVQHAVLEA